MATVLGDRATPLFLGQVVAAAVAFVVNVLAARSLALSGRGELALMLQVGYLASLGLLLGRDRSGVAVLSPSAPAAAARAFLRLLAGPAAVGTVAGTVLLLVPSGEVAWHRFGVALLFGVVNAGVRAVRAAAVTCHRERDYLGWTVGGQLGLLAALTVMSVLGVRSSTAWVVVYAAAGLVPVVGPLAQWWAVPGPDVRPAGDLRRARREGLTLLPAAVANTGMLRLDRLLLPALASSQALGVYAAVATMTELLAWPLLALGESRTGTWRSQFRAGLRPGRRVLRGAVAYGAVSGLVAIPVLWVALVPLLGRQFATSRALVVPLVTAAVVLGLTQVLVALLIARCRNRAAVAADTTGFVVSAAAYVVLIPGHAAAGAAWGSLIGYGAGLVVAAAAFHRSR